MIRTRFAPSPTGFLHIGGLRTAVYAYALAKHSQGQFLLRIEDTDQKREVAGATQALKDTLLKFGLVWDELYVQSDRAKSGVYKEAAEKLVKNGQAFFCQCPAKNAKLDGFTTILRDPCRDKNFTSGAIKLKVPDGQIVKYRDFVHRKEISWETSKVYDATLLKSDGFPTYHLAVAVDDLDMGITHILRGHDWLPSTPIHLLVFSYLGFTRPEIGHLSDILSVQTGKKLSKRRDSVFVEQFLADGYLPEALLNFIFLLGWAPKDNRELYTLDEFVQAFDPKGFQEANPHFYSEKLNWFNGQYIRRKSDEELVQLIKPHYADPKLPQILPLIKDRLVSLADFPKLAKVFTERPAVSADPAMSPSHLTFAIANIDALLRGELVESVKSQGWKVGDFFMSLRLAICGSRQTPPLTETMQILGKEESLSRLSLALNLLAIRN